MARPPIPGYPTGHRDPRIAPDSDPPVVEQASNHRASSAELAEFQQTVHVQHRGFRATVPAVVVTALITAGSAWLLRPSAVPELPPGCLTKQQFDESNRVRDEQMARRFDAIETDTSYLKITVRLVQDRLPPQK